MRMDIFTSVFFSSGRIMVYLQLGQTIFFSKYLPLTISNLSPFNSLLALRKELCLLLLSLLSGDAVKYTTFARLLVFPPRTSQRISPSPPNRLFAHACSIFLFGSQSIIEIEPVNVNCYFFHNPKKKATIEVAYNHSRKNGGSLICHKDNVCQVNKQINRGKSSAVSEICV